jgi:putative transcription factor
MVQCEMCGADTSDPKTVKVEGAELDVCSECADFGTEVTTQGTSSTSTKYSTGSSSSASGSSSSSTSGSSSGSGSGGSGGGRRPSDMFDDMGELAQDYDDIIRDARESKGLSQSELADELNEKASLITKLERGDTLPSDDVQSKLERYLGINLDAGSGSPDETDWEGGSATETTLGDVVQRKD